VSALTPRFPGTLVDATRRHAGNAGEGVLADAGWHRDCSSRTSPRWMSGRASMSFSILSWCGDLP
jgi:hypothetical protein